MEPLLASASLPSSLSELESSPLFAAAAAGPFDAADLAAWLKGAREQPLAAMDWGLVLAAVKAGQQQGWQAAGLRAGQLVSVLAWAAEGAQQQLLLGAGCPAAAAGGAAPAVEDVGNPRQRQARQSTLKLSLFFLCCIAKGESSAAQHADAVGGAQKPAAKKAKGGGGEGSAAHAAQLQLRRDALLAVGSIEEVLQAEPALLSAVSDLRAAHRLARATALHCLVHPLAPAGGGGGGAGGGGGDRSVKALADSCFEAMAGERECGARMSPINCCMAHSMPTTDPSNKCIPPAGRACLASPLPARLQSSCGARLSRRRSARARLLRPRCCKRWWAWWRSQCSRPRWVLRAVVSRRPVVGAAPLSFAVCEAGCGCCPWLLRG